MNTQRYRLVVGVKEDLEAEVDQLMAEGWKPLCNPSVCSQDRPYEFCQALVFPPTEP